MTMTEKQMQALIDLLVIYRMENPKAKNIRRALDVVRRNLRRTKARNRFDRMFPNLDGMLNRITTEEYSNGR